MALIKEPKIKDPEEIGSWWWRDMLGFIEGIEDHVYVVIEVGDDQVTLAPFDDQDNWERWATFMIDKESAKVYCADLWSSIRAELDEKFDLKVEDLEQAPESMVRILMEGRGRNPRELKLDYVEWDNVENGFIRVQPGSVEPSGQEQQPVAAPETVDVSFVRAMMVGGIDNDRLIRLVKNAAKRGVWLSPIYTEGKALPAVLPEGVQLILVLKGGHVTVKQEKGANELARANDVPIAGIRIQNFSVGLTTILDKLSLTPTVRKALKSAVTKGPYPGMKSAVGEGPTVYGYDGLESVFGDPIYGTGDIEMAGEQPDGWPDESEPPGTSLDYSKSEVGLSLAAVGIPLAAILLRR